MADIGAILLPDPNLMAGYQQSFDKQMALKQYVAQDSRQQEQQFAKESYFMPDADLQAYKGQSAAMALNVQKYMQHRQELSADRSRGGFFGLDPKAQAELAAEKYSLMQDQATRLNAITKLTSALPTIRKVGFGSSYNQKYTEDWMAKLNKGEVPEGEPIQALPKDGSLVVDELFSKLKPDTIYSNPIKKGHIVNSTQTSYLPEIAGASGFNQKTYKTQGYEWLHSQVKNNPAVQQIIDDNFDVYAQNNPQEAKQLVADQGQNASYALFTAQHKNQIEANMLGTTSPGKPRYIEGAQNKLTEAEKEYNIKDNTDIQALNLHLDLPFKGNKDLEAAGAIKGQTYTSKIMSINKAEDKAKVSVVIPGSGKIPTQKMTMDVPYSDVQDVVEYKHKVIGTSAPKRQDNSWMSSPFSKATK